MLRPFFRQQNYSDNKVYFAASNSLPSTKERQSLVHDSRLDNSPRDK
jgi:hypothetical protein